MIVECLVELLHDLALSAIAMEAMIIVVNDGPGPARVLARDDSDGIVIGAFVAQGDMVRVNRRWRVKVELVDRVTIRPLCYASANWTTD